MPTENVILARPAVIAGYVAPGPVVGALDVAPSPVDLRWSGQFRIVGTTKNKATPADVAVSRRVRLHDKKSGDPVREIWSDAGGVYAFNHIASGLYYVVGFDHTDTFGAVIADKIPAEPMP